MLSAAVLMEGIRRGEIVAVVGGREGAWGREGARLVWGGASYTFVVVDFDLWCDGRWRYHGETRGSSRRNVDKFKKKAGVTDFSVEEEGQIFTSLSKTGSAHEYKK